MLPNDPTLLKDLGDAHLAELRATAAAYRNSGSSSVAVWRAIAGRAMLRGALRLLGEPGTAELADPSGRADHT